MQCSGLTISGDPCRAQAVHGSTMCFKHDPDHSVASAEANRAGGRVRTGQMARPVAAPLDVTGLDLTTAAGLTEYVARALRRLADLPFDTKVAAVVAQLVTCQRTTVETTDLAARLATLEGRRPNLRRIS
jgi:hypothetical protein